MSDDRELTEADRPSWPDLIPLRKATEISGLTQEHLANRIRKGDLWGTKLGGRNWFTTKEAIKDYLAKEHRSGPKPKRP